MTSHNRRLSFFAALLGLFSCASVLPGWGQASAPDAAMVRGKQGCTFGGPVYCSPTDLTPAPLKTVPDVGRLLGSGTVVTDPTFGNPLHESPIGTPKAAAAATTNSWWTAAAALKSTS